MSFNLGIRGSLLLAVSCTAVAALATMYFMRIGAPREQTALLSEQMAPPKDTIFSRKILMGAIDMNMDEIETMLAPEGKLDLAEAGTRGNDLHNVDGVSTCFRPSQINGNSERSAIPRPTRSPLQTLEEFFRFLSARHKYFKTCLRCKSCKTRCRFQAAYC